MRLFQKVQVDPELTLRVSNHFFYSNYGVRGRYEVLSKLGSFIAAETPGTGFFVRESDSHTYHKFVRAERDKHKQSVLTLLLGKEFSFQKEFDRIKPALAAEPDKEKVRILNAYQNCLFLAKDEEGLERIVRAIKNEIGDHPNKYLMGLLTRYKSRIASLERDIKSTQLNVADQLQDEQAKERWEKLVEAFDHLIAMPRIWHETEEEGQTKFAQVFFDYGIFDFIQSSYDTPLMRDSAGCSYFFYPNGLLKARSAVDFEVRKWRDLNVMFEAVDPVTMPERPHFYEHKKRNLWETVKHRLHKMRKPRFQLTDVGTDPWFYTDFTPDSSMIDEPKKHYLGKLSIKEMDVTFYFSDVLAAKEFYEAVEALKH